MENPEENLDPYFFHFLAGFGRVARSILEEYLAIPNKSDIGPEYMSLKMRRGEQQVSEISDKVDELRKKLGLNYSVLQEKLFDFLMRSKQE